MSKGYKIKAKTCDGCIVVGSPKDMYPYLYQEFVDMENKEEITMDIIKWARRKSVGAKFENDVLTVEVIEN